MDLGGITIIVNGNVNVSGGTPSTDTDMPDSIPVQDRHVYKFSLTENTVIPLDTVGNGDWFCTILDVTGDGASTFAIDGITEELSNNTNPFDVTRNNYIVITGIDGKVKSYEVRNNPLDDLTDPTSAILSLSNDNATGQILINEAIRIFEGTDVQLNGFIANGDNVTSVTFANFVTSVDTISFDINELGSTISTGQATLYLEIVVTDLAGNNATLTTNTVTFNDETAWGFEAGVMRFSNNCTDLGGGQIRATGAINTNHATLTKKILAANGGGEIRGQVNDVSNEACIVALDPTDTLEIREDFAYSINFHPNQEIRWRKLGTLFGSGSEFPATKPVVVSMLWSGTVVTWRYSEDGGTNWTVVDTQADSSTELFYKVAPVPTGNSVLCSISDNSVIIP